MITWFNNLNLKPQERRLVIGALVVGFILVNVWFVWPHFGDWAKNSRRAEDAELAVTRYQKEVNNIPRYKTLIKELEKVAQFQSLLWNKLSNFKKRYKK